MCIRVCPCVSVDVCAHNICTIVHLRLERELNSEATLHPSGCLQYHMIHFIQFQDLWEKFFMSAI